MNLNTYTLIPGLAIIGLDGDKAEVSLLAQTVIISQMMNMVIMV